jgi:hypothetical protein
MTVLRFGTDTGRVSQSEGRDTPRWVEGQHKE